jgi:hypothetical protein
MGRRKGPVPIMQMFIKKTNGKIVDVASAILNKGSGVSILPEEQAEIHRGNAYAGGEVGVNLGVGDSFYILGRNNNSEGKRIHVTAAVSVSADAIVRTLGGVTGQSGGSAKASYNRKTGLTDSGVEVWWGATPDSGYSSVKGVFLPGGTGPLSLGGSVTFRAERIVEAGDWIGLEIENVSGLVMAHYGIEWDFYLADPDE